MKINDSRGTVSIWVLSLNHTGQKIVGTLNTQEPYKYNGR
jgi:hypothetical protein